MSAEKVIASYGTPRSLFSFSRTRMQQVHTCADTHTRTLSGGGFLIPAAHCGPEQPKIQTKVLGHLLRSLAPLTHSLAPHYSLRLRAALQSLARSLAHLAHSLARGKVKC